MRFWLPILGAAVVGAPLTFGCTSQDTFTVTEPATATETFSQKKRTTVDVLWVVDNSESMAPKQTNLGTSFDNFISFFLEQTVDYRIGVISTDPDDGGRLHAGPAGQAVISVTSDQPATLFAENVRVGTSGTKLEKPFESLGLALGFLGDTAGAQELLREEAALFIITVSDEDDESFGPAGYYARELETIKGFGNDQLVSVSAIAGDPAEGCEENGGATAASRLNKLVTETGGVFSSVCEEDFSVALEELAFSAIGLKTSFPLSEQPIKSAATINQCPPAQVREGLCVSVDGEYTTEGWFYDQPSNSVVFEPGHIPQAGSEIVVEYIKGE